MRCLPRQQQVLSILDRIGEKPSAEDHEGLSFWAVSPWPFSASSGICSLCIFCLLARSKRARWQRPLFGRAMVSISWTHDRKHEVMFLPFIRFADTASIASSLQASDYRSAEHCLQTLYAS